MNLRDRLLVAGLAVMALLAPGCVQSLPESAYAPPPQPPAYAPPSAYQPPPPPAEAEPMPPPMPPLPRTPPPVAAAPLSGIDQLLAPIALYPDPLVALILPAATVPGDLTAAASYLVQYGDPTRIDGQPWDASVRALARYPSVLTWLADNPAWTEALGAAFLASPSGVMQSIQRLRARALEGGALVSTPQQQVSTDGGEIEILPAQAGAIYVPSYDPDVVYSEGPYDVYGGPPLAFGPPCVVGPWLDFGFDWSGQHFWVGDWNYWHSPGGWHRPRFEGGRPPAGVQPWHAPARAQRSAAPPPGAHPNAAPRPRPMPGAPRPAPARTQAPAGRVLAPTRTTGSAQAAPRPGTTPMEHPRLNPAAPGPGSALAAPRPGTTPMEHPRLNPAAPGPGSALAAPRPGTTPMERPRLNPAAPAPAGATHAVAGQPVSRANENESRPVVVEPRQGAPLAETRRYETAAPRGQAPAAPAARPERPPPAPATAPAPAPTQDPRSH